ncbi:hypothetical protein FRC07_004197 [Ceratobasidium sp. 392]|nr:hypothetical protein FRC07_004197 [Ceratobasidium sp. 392]
MSAPSRFESSTTYPPVPVGVECKLRFLPEVPADPQHFEPDRDGAYATAKHGPGESIEAVPLSPDLSNCQTWIIEPSESSGTYHIRFVEPQARDLEQRLGFHNQLENFPEPVNLSSPSVYMIRALKSTKAGDIVSIIHPVEALIIRQGSDFVSVSPDDDKLVADRRLGHDQEKTYPGWLLVCQN